MTEDESQRLLVDWNKTEVEYPRDRCLHQLFEEQVERTPDAVALTFEQQSLTYRELNERANRLAHLLRGRGVGPEGLVGLYLDRSMALVTSILGILKAGGAYLPLDLSSPKGRLEFMLEQGRVQVLVTETKLLGKLPVTAAKVLCLDGAEASGLSNQPQTNPANQTQPDQLAYVIFTSGSTGLPKGCAITHHNVVRLMLATEGWFGFNERDVWTLFHSYAFDFSVWELWGALLYGGRLVLVPYFVSRSPTEFYDLLVREQVTVLNQTPSAFRQLIQADQAATGELSLRYVIFGGEALELRSLVPWFARHGDERPRLVNMYGITETTVHVTYRPLTKEDLNRGSVIGRPIPDLQLLILDEHRQPVPMGVTGEMYIGGAGLARGYLNQPELTAERFIPHPFSEKRGARLYQTGDLARGLPDGDIEYRGRLDHQEKIRGFRIELGEIETVMASHPGLHGVVVMAKGGKDGDKRLVAYVEVREFPGPEVAELREFLQAKLPDYMVPAAIVKLASFPLNANGKIDRGALPEPDEAALARYSEFVAPRTETEKKLAVIWSEVLGGAEVGVHDNFFDLGGHSLNAIQIVSRVRAAFSRDLPIHLLFQQPTIEQLSAALDQLPVADIPAAGKSHLLAALAGRRPRTQTGPAPASSNQAQLWFLQRLNPQSCVYNLAQEIRLSGELDEVALRRSLEELFRRHEVLRMRFEEVDGQPVQVPSELEPELRVQDLRDMPTEHRTVEVRRLAHEEISRPFDLANGPLVRTTLVRVGEVEHVLLFGVHHIVYDGWSTDLLVRDLMAGYEAFRQSRAATLPDLEATFGDFADWQHEFLRSEKVAAHRVFWQQELAGVPTVLDLPNQLPAGSRAEPTQGQRALILPRDVTSAVRRLGQARGATVFATLLAAFQAVLHRHTGQQQFLVGIPFAARSGREVENTIGFFVNSLPIKADFSGNPAFEDFLSQIQNRLWRVQSHQNFPFEQLVQALPPERNGNRNPFFQILVAYEVLSEVSRQCGGLRVQVDEILPVQPMFELTVLLRDRGREVEVMLLFDRRFYEDFAVSQLAGHFETLLAGVVANPQARVSALPLLTSRERKQLIEDWNTTAAEYPRDKCIHQLFEQQVERTPDAVAVVREAEKLTYRELNRQANRLALWLRQQGIGPGHLVGLLLERSVEFVVGVLACLKAAAAYLPLDLGQPPARIQLMLRTAAPRLVVGRGTAAEEALAGTGVPYRDWADLPAALADCSAGNLESVNTAADLAYVMFTSGSTGEPKGVMVPHRAVVRLVGGQSYLPFHERLTCLLLSPTAFDASTLELWAPLLHGGKLVIFPEGELDLTRLGATIANHGITCLWLTSALFNLVLDHQPEILTSVRYMLSGGEALSVAHVRRALARLPQAQIINGYGPTEGTTFTTTYAVNGDLTGDMTSVPIGRPMANTRVYILDAQLQAVPVGVAGELHIGGDGLARGYLNRPQLTAEKFIPNPFSSDPNARLYKTGDLCRYLPDGNIEFLGRLDQQVKIRGFRIELGEVEAMLGSHPGVQGAVVVAKVSGVGDKKLVAYVVVRKQQGPGVAELREYVKAILPDYMVPAVITRLESFPLNANGKIDRGALPEPEGDWMVRESEYVVPRTELEKKLAAIWSEVLGVVKVGIHDNFFDLGGHSLAAVQVQSRVERELGRRVSLAGFFQYPNITKLAAAIGQVDLSAKPRTALTLLSSRKSDAPPLFCLHFLSASQRLARHLQSARMVFGMDTQMDDALRLWHIGRQVSLTVEQIAERCCAEIIKAQPDGPYLLAGFCFGGVVAFEVASRLTHSGRNVDLLALLDAVYLPGCPPLPRPQLRRASYHLRRVIGEGLGYLFSKVTNRMSLKARRHSQLLRLRSNSSTAMSPLELPRAEFLGKLLEAYHARPYAGDALLLRSAVEPNSFSHDLGPTNGWHSVIQGHLEIAEISCNHMDISEEPHIGEVARRLESYLLHRDQR